MIKKIIEKFKSLFPKKKKFIYKPIAVIPEFNKNIVIKDSQFHYLYFDIKTLLESKGSFLTNLTFGTTPFVDWMKECCTQHNVNPKLILAVLEKNGNLITRKESPSKEYLDNVLIQAPHLKGLDAQLNYFTYSYRRWFDAFNIARAGRVNCVDDTTVKPENAFTYALYMMDPYVGTDDLYQVKTLRGDDRIVTGTERKLRYKAPFGVYKTYLIWREWFYESPLGSVCQ
jgi:hypothetical protein